MSLTNDFDLQMNGETYKLQFTPRIGAAISNEYGGFGPAFDAMRLLNLKVVQYIVRTGTGGKGPDGRPMSAEQMNDAVWSHGVGRLTKPLSKYLVFLQNGGRDPELDPKEDDEQADQGNG